MKLYIKTEIFHNAIYTYVNLLLFNETKYLPTQLWHSRITSAFYKAEIGNK